MTKNCQF